MTQVFHRFNRRSIRLSLVCFVLLASSAWACQVPVFRYALERWAADKYEILILHQTPLTESDRGRLDQMLQHAEDGNRMPANFVTRVVDISQAQTDERLLALWSQHAGQSADPIMVTLYPRNARDIPDRVADVSPFDDISVQRLIDSPVRRKLVEELLDGQSAVWIFVPSGHVERDEKALATLEQQLALHEKTLELPPQEEIEADEFYQPNTKIELKIGFSVVTLARDDPREQFLLRSLLGSESDLKQFDEPLAFPVLGRGRVLYALVGKGIMAETIGMASRFVVGPCSCQVKEQNPGFDLLLAADWDTRLGVDTITQPPGELSREPVLLAIPPGRAKE